MDLFQVSKTVTLYKLCILLDKNRSSKDCGNGTTKAVNIKQAFLDHFVWNNTNSRIRTVARRQWKLKFIVKLTLYDSRLSESLNQSEIVVFVVTIVFQAELFDELDVFAKCSAKRFGTSVWDVIISPFHCSDLMIVENDILHLIKFTFLHIWETGVPRDIFSVKLNDF